MTLQDLFDKMAENPTGVLIYFAALPIAAFIVGAISRPHERYQAPIKYLYTAIIYAACLPGICALTLCLYQVFFERAGLLNLNVFAYFLPVIAMGITIFILRSQIDFNHIPGFDRLSGLMMVIAATFIAIIIIQKTHIWIWIQGTFTHLVILFVLLFLVFRWGMGKIFGGGASQNVDIN